MAAKDKKEDEADTPENDEVVFSLLLPPEHIGMYFGLLYEVDSMGIDIQHAVLRELGVLVLSVPFSTVEIIFKALKSHQERCVEVSVPHVLFTSAPVAGLVTVVGSTSLVIEGGGGT